jgi:hypothetical protein
MSVLSILLLASVWIRSLRQLLNHMPETWTYLDSKEESMQTYEQEYTKHPGKDFFLPQDSNDLSLLMLDIHSDVSLTICLALIGESTQILIRLLFAYLGFLIISKTIATFSIALLKYREILLFWPFPVFGHLQVTKTYGLHQISSQFPSAHSSVMSVTKEIESSRTTQERYCPRPMALIQAG